MSKDDYKDASKRHLDDAELLFAQTPQRLANASHLFGLSAECSLKAIARHFNRNAKFSGRTGHIPELFAELHNVSAIGTNPILEKGIREIQPKFNGWIVGQRYACQAHFVADTVVGEQGGANDCYRLMTNCVQGLI